MDIINLFPEGFRMFKNHLRVLRNGFYRYPGDSEGICRQVVESCWNGHFFVVSSKGNYPYFWARDFSWVIDSLLSLGYEERVRKTLEYAMSTYLKNGRMSVSIRPNGKGFDFPTYAPDTLASMLYCLSRLGDKRLVFRYKAFLNKEIYRFSNIVVEKLSGLPKKRHFSSMKDFSIRERSCYDLVMCYMVQRYSGELGLDNPLAGYDYKEILMKHYWTGSYFKDDLSGKEYVTGDAQVFAFWSGLIEDDDMLLKVINTVNDKGLDKPFPLKYNNKEDKVRMIWLEFLLDGWERDTLWMHMGPLYVLLVSRVDKDRARSYLETYREMIEKQGNFLELFDPKGKPYNTLLYSSSESMIWAANYLTLSSLLKADININKNVDEISNKEAVQKIDKKVNKKNITKGKNGTKAVSQLPSKSKVGSYPIKVKSQKMKGGK